MSTKFKGIIAVALCLCLVFSGAVASSAAYVTDDAAKAVTSLVGTSADGLDDGGLFSHATVTDDKGVEHFIFTPEGAAYLASTVHDIGSFIQVVWRYLHAFVSTMVSIFATVVPSKKDVTSVDDYDSKNFYSGNTAISENDGGRWSLGYDSTVLTPDDFYTHKYIMGGYALNKYAVDKYDDIKVRTICLDDGSSRGVTVFAVVDCIGLSNYDVRIIRQNITDKAAARGVNVNFDAINISVTHTHSGLDTQGIWASEPLTTLNNLSVNAGLFDGETKQGTDPELMSVIYDRVSDSVLRAYAAMEPGKLYFAMKDETGYFNDKADPDIIIENIYRFRFDPDDPASKETMIGSFGCHPETVGFTVDDYVGDKMSADFVAYADQVVSSYGYNFIFIQGAIGALISSGRGPSNDGLDIDRYQSAVRYGWEMGYLLLGMTYSEKECAAKLDGNSTQYIYEHRDADTYTLWYKDWQPVTETEVAPILNISLKEVLFNVDNPVLEAIGKDGLASNVLLNDSEGNTWTVTEYGYMELGNKIKVILSPGETAPELIIGGSTMTAGGSVSGKDFKYNCISSYFDKDDVIIDFDVMNDAIGYIVPDNDYGLATLRYDDENKVWTYNADGILSFGSKSGSMLVDNFLTLAGKKH